MKTPTHRPPRPSGKPRQPGKSGKPAGLSQTGRKPSPKPFRGPAPARAEKAGERDSAATKSRASGAQARSTRGGRHRAAGKPVGEELLLVYGIHTVRAALSNPARRAHRLHATSNGLERLADTLSDARAATLEIREVESRDLQNLVGAEAVHQGVVLECEPLDALDPSELFALADHDLLLVLDQVTDPHNVGAILRSAVALGCGAVITTARHAASESAVLAKSASGTVDMIDQMQVRNLSKCIAELADLGFITVGLDSEGPADMARTLEDDGLREDRRFRAKPLKLAIVLGSEGKGLRQQTAEACTVLARLDMPGPIRSLNVSNAAVLALYLARAALNKTA